MAKQSGRSSGGAMSGRLGMTDAVVVGLSSMIGAGVFAAFAPAAAAAGSGLLIGLAVAAVIAYCNATSSARLAALYPQSGGTYVYGRERLGPFWGYLAGWGFIVGKTASCAAMALTVGAYAWPGQERAIAVAVVIALTAVNYLGIQKSALVSRMIVMSVLVVLAGVVIVTFTGRGREFEQLTIGSDATVHGVLQGAGLLFFAFAGYARIATLGEEVRDPARIIPRAIPMALALTLIVYCLVALALLTALGAGGVASASDPIAAAADAAGAHWLSPAVRVGAVLAAAGSLLALILGVSRTTLAMARDRHLPSTLAAIHPRFETPHHADVATGGVIVAIVAVADIREVIGFSSFAVLVYYLIANVCASTLRADEGPPRRFIPVIGAVGCGVLALTLPWESIVAGTGILIAGGALYRLRARPSLSR